MYVVTKGSIYEIWDEKDFESLLEALEEGRCWAEEYPEEEVIIYDDDSQPVLAWMGGQVTYKKEWL